MSLSNLHVFSLPPDLLDSLTLRTLQPPAIESSRSPSPPASNAPKGTSSANKCTFCVDAFFSDVEDQRSHFRSDWHRYNVKIRLQGGRPVSEKEFLGLVDDLSDSLSGSASSEDDLASDSDVVETILAKAPKNLRPSSPEQVLSIPRTALSWFHSPPSTQIGVYNALFSEPHNVSSHLEELRSIQQGPEEGRIWTMLMVAGGHFAGVVVRVSKPNSVPSSTKQTKAKHKQSEIEVLRHKTFHRYTTRRKQGGSQSVNDNAKGNAKSAGATLRRYGEQALKDDIRNLMGQWTEEVARSERIWIRASVANKRIFYDYDEAVFRKGDERLRSFPFPTRRPTQSELLRCLTELTRVKVSHLTEDALRAQEEAYLASLPKPKPPPVSAPPVQKTIQREETPRLSKEEELLREKWNRALEMIRKGRLEALKAFWDREGETLGGADTRVPDWEDKSGGATLLQVAAASGQEEVTQWLLEDIKANPTLPVSPRQHSQADRNESVSDAPDIPATAGSARHTAYDLAATRGVRDVFRRCAGAHPDWWDWLGAGRVPSVLSEEMEANRDEKKKNRRKGLRDKVREREGKEQAKTPEPVPTVQPTAPTPMSTSTSRKLGGQSGDVGAVAGLTPEARARIERERRARAAEARLQGRAT